MNKYKEIYGIDISKAVFDVYGSETGHTQFKNDAQGFKSFLKHLPEGVSVFMEATGYYHYRLAQFLFKSNILVSVVNPLSVKRFIQMKLAKVKSVIVKVARKLLSRTLAVIKTEIPYEIGVIS